MAKNKPDKKITGIEATFENILVCNDKRLRPYIEIFVFEPENMTQRPLGTLLGVFEIADTSEDSSYIVNYLSSVIKKEYFSKAKRPPIESFEAALHRANLALSKLAEHGNVKWLGKLNALVAIIEKNNLHLAQTGTASAFLLRSKGLTDISEGLSSSEPEPHPLKTFVNVSSGRLEIQDKLIITTGDIFEIFSFEEIKKSALRFSGEKFIQFLKTALGNELQKAAVLVVDMHEKESQAPAMIPKKDKSLNAFSQSAFFKEPAANASRRAADGPAREKNPEKINREITEEIKKGQPEFTNEKNGHIYIKETMEESLNPRQTSSAEYLAVLGGAFGAMHKNLKKISRNSGQLLLSTAKKISLPKFKPAEPVKNIAAPETITEAEPDEKFIVPETKLAETIVLPETKNPEPLAMPEAEPLPVQKNDPVPFLQKFKAAVQAGAAPAEKSLPPEDGAQKNFLAKLAIAQDKIKPLANSLKPNFSRIKNIAAKLDYQQRIYAVLLVLAIIVVPFFGLKLSAYIQSKNAKPVAPVAEVVVPLAQDKNVSQVQNINSAYAGSDIVNTVNLGNKIYAVTQAQIVDLASQDATPIPGDFGQIKLAVGMDDLNLIFLLNQSGKLISFSPVPKKFQDNTLTIPDNANIIAAGTYLTYLYLFDAQNNQIYRYPRATGGFGDKTNWLKDTADLSKTTGVALSDNIYVANNDTLTKLFKGQKQNFNLESTATPIAPFKVFTKPEFSYVYILDKQNSRVVKIDPNGQIIFQYYNPAIASATDFSVDEVNNTVYISSPTDINSFQMN